MDNRIDAVFNDYLKDLKRLIQHHSVFEKSDTSAFGQGIKDALEEVILIAQEMGFKTYLDEQGHYAYAEIGEGIEMFGVLGHMDVVPAGELSLWNTDPFQLVHDETYVYGRGVADDKGPVLTAMYALKLAMDQGLKLKQRVRFILGGDEESLWRCMKAYVEYEELPTQGFTPDSRFPLIYAEKGLIQFNLYADDLEDAGFNGGAAYNAVPEKAVIDANYAKLFSEDNQELEFDNNGGIIIKGKASHAMYADQGMNANVLAASQLYEKGVHNPMIDFIVEKGSQPNGELVYGLLEDYISGKLMFNVAIVEGNKIGLDIRYPVTISKEIILDGIQGAVSQYGIRLEEHDFLRAIHMDQNLPFIQTLMKIYQIETGEMDAKPISSGGATYARAMDNIVAFGPSNINHQQYEHQPNERVLKSDIKLAMKIYYETFKELVFEAQ